MDITIPVIESQGNQQDTIDFHYFHAEIIKDSLDGEVRITATSEAAIIFLKPVSTPVDILWYQLKEVFVNQIFINSKQNKGIRIRSFILESYYNWVNKARGVLTKTSLSYKVRWFLSELLVVAPNSSARKMGQLQELNKQKVLQQYLLTNMDTMVLNLKIVATKLVMKMIRSEMLIKILESGIAQVENYSFLRHLVMHLSDEEDEVINKHIALSDYAHAALHAIYQEMLVEGMQKHLEKSGEEDGSYYDILIADLHRNLKNVDKGENLLGKIKENDLSIAEFISDTNREIKSDFETKNIQLKKDKELGTDKIEDFEHFILTELEKAVKYSEKSILQRYEDMRDISKSATTTESKKNKDANKSNEVDLHSSQNQNRNQSKVEDRKNKVRSFLQDVVEFLQATKLVDAKMEHVAVEEQQKEKSAEMNVRNVKINEKHMLESGTDIGDTQHDHEINSEAKSFNQEDAIGSEVVPKLKELKKPSRITGEEEHVDEDKDKKAKPKTRTAKHIDDEL